MSPLKDEDGDYDEADMMLGELLSRFSLSFLCIVFDLMINLTNELLMASKVVCISLFNLGNFVCRLTLSHGVFDCHVKRALAVVGSLIYFLNLNTHSYCVWYSYALRVYYL